MYSTKNIINNNEDFTSSYMSAGINENITLKSVDTKSLSNSERFP